MNLEHNKMKIIKSPSSKPNHLYIAIWRWHFYAGIIIAPFIILLSITGGIYLFKPQMESILYQDLYYIQEGKQKVPSSEQIESVRNEFPNAQITSFKPSYESGRTSEIGMVENKQNISVFINPYNGDIVGKIKDDETLMARLKGLHNGELWGGKVGNLLIELVACWSVILVVSGVYLWWPRKRKSIFGTFIPRLINFKKKRIFWRDLHAVTAVWFSIFIVIQLFSGLMWTDVWGGTANKLVNSTGTGGPVGDQPFEKFAFPTSTIPTKDVADVPWAAENLPVPESKPSDQQDSIPVDSVMQIAESNNVKQGYTICFPENETGVYTVYLDPADVYPNRPSPNAQQTLHIDQYSGAILEDYGWSDYGFIGKVISLTIAFHQGEFGLVNQLFNLVLVAVFMVIPISGIVMWWKRRPRGKLGVPVLSKNFKFTKGLIIITALFGLFFPLVGLSLVLIWLLDLLLFKKISGMKKYLL